MSHGAAWLMALAAAASPAHAANGEAATAPATAPAPAAAASAPESPPSTEWLPLVVPVVEHLDGVPKEEFKAKYRPVVLAGRGLAVGEVGAAHGTPIRMLTTTQAREEQLAHFLWITKAEVNGDTAKVSFQRPSSAHSGTVTLAREAGAWKVTDVRQIHSSSLGRLMYGSLYNGTTCRDGTEMAERWNFYVSMIKALQARQPFDPKAPVDKVCPGTEFPEVIAWRAATKTAPKSP